MKSLFQTPIDIISKSFEQWKNNLHHTSALEVAKQRVMIIGVTISLAFLVVIVRLGDVMLLKQRDRFASTDVSDFSVMRSDITDCQNQILATNIVTASAYANPKQIINIEEAAQKLSTVIELSQEEIEKRIKGGKNFVWLMRHISPKMQADILNLGIPGIYMYRDQTRVYPHGPLLSHILGMCGIDGNGLSGVEAYFDARLQEDREPLALSIDLRVQHILHNELSHGVEEFSANGANAIVMRVKTGEVLGMVSLPDYDPHAPSKYEQISFFNRNTLGSYEPGSVFKILNVAIALESGKANLNSIYDGSAPIHIGRFKVSDFKGLNRPMTLVEAFVKSSNIAAAKISQQFGPEVQKEYMKKFGALEKMRLEIPEVGVPLIPKNWTNVSMMTISYGYGISQTPLQLLSIIASVVNGGHKVRPSLLKITGSITQGDFILNEKTSATVRNLMRKVVVEGTAKKANVPGFDVFGKTGTAYQKTTKGGYGSDANRKRTTTFIGGFPENDPEVMLIVMMDDPKPTKETAGYATAGWNAAKVAGNIIKRVAPLFVQPKEVEPQLSNVAEKKTEPTKNEDPLAEKDDEDPNPNALESIEDLFDATTLVKNISATEDVKN